MIKDSNSMCCALTVVAALMLPAAASAQEPIVTDRPNVAYSSLTVGTYQMQAEVGTDVSVVDGDASVLLPTKLRLGLTRYAEVHVEGGILGVNAEFVELADLDLGGKLNFYNGGDTITGVGLLFSVTLPIGGETLTTGDVVLKPTLAADFSFNDYIGLGTNIGLTLPYNDFDSEAVDVLFAASLGVNPGVDKLNIFIEGFGNVTFAGDLGVSTDFGVLYALSDSMQLDAYARIGLVETDEFGAGVGFSVRL